MGYAHEYATAVMWRGRIEMEPADFVPDWSDRPRKDKVYPGAERFPLPDGDVPARATVQRGLFGPGCDGDFTLPLLAGMLRDSYGLVGRRLAVQANTDLSSLPFYAHANWSRGTASGGGLYPVGVHWVCGPRGPLAPGVYHYATPHHAMTRLLSGDVTDEVRAALPGGADDTDQFLVLSVKFWQNAFKYNSFCYHAVTMDVGALLQTWRVWARARGLRIAPALWFDEDRLSRLLGVEAEQEGVFAVVPLRWEGAAATPRSGPSAPRPAARTARTAQHADTSDLSDTSATSDGPGAAAPAASQTAAAGRRPADPATARPAPRVRRTDQECSRRVLTFETIRRIHAATLQGAADRPAPGALTSATALTEPSGGTRVPLPEAPELATDVRRALRARRSSFGRFSARRPVRAEQLSAALAAAVAGARLDSDAESPGGEPLARLYVFANHVEGVAPGAYGYDRHAHELRLVRAGAPGGFLQRNYFLANYNLEQTGAVIVPTVRTHAVLDAVGDRGYRLVNAVIGSVAQAVYTASAAAGLACGVALGFDSVSYVEELDLDASGEVPLLLMMIGNERPEPAHFVYEIA